MRTESGSSMRVSRTLLKWVLPLCGIVLLLGIPIAQSTISGRVVWFVRVSNARGEVDGHTVPCRVYRCLRQNIHVVVLVQSRETYWISALGGRPPSASSCRDWSPWLPLFVMSGSSSPCFYPDEGGSVAGLRGAGATVGTRGAGFKSMAGQNVRLTW